MRVKLVEWLRAERRTQGWLAEQIGGTHQTTVSSWLHGRDIPLEKARRIAEVTGLSVDDVALVVSEPPASAPTLPADDSSDDTAA